MPRGKIDESAIVPIVGDGAIGHPAIADGRIIPVLIVDCAKHQALYELILLHESTPPGDATLVWGRQIFNKKHVYLTVEFSRPLPIKIVLRFTLTKHAGLVDGIIQSRGVYLQPLQSGRKVLEGVDKPKILVEVPSSATFSEWKELHHASVVRNYRKDGAPKSIAKALADEHLERLSEIWGRRQRHRPDPPNEA
jgi:hypothetical protein